MILVLQVRTKLHNPHGNCHIWFSSNEGIYQLVVCYLFVSFVFLVFKNAISRLIIYAYNSMNFKKYLSAWSIQSDPLWWLIIDVYEKRFHAYLYKCLYVYIVNIACFKLFLTNMANRYEIRNKRIRTYYFHTYLRVEDIKGLKASSYVNTFTTSRQYIHYPLSFHGLI